MEPVCPGQPPVPDECRPAAAVGRHNDRVPPDSDTVPAAPGPADAIAAQLPATDRRSWVALVAIALIVLAGVVWTFLGQAPETVRGPGMIVPTGGFVDVGTGVAGVVTELTVRPGDAVQADEVVATLVTADGTTEQVRAPVAGVVSNVVGRQGGATEPGTPLVIMDPESSGNSAVAFLPAEQGARAKAGMTALIALASLPQSQYGYLVGTVESVSLLPTTTERVAALVGGDQRLPDYFMASGPVLEVSIRLNPDPSTATGYAWTTGDGPDVAIATGALAQVAVVLSDSTPWQRITG